MVDFMKTMISGLKMYISNNTVKPDYLAEQLDKKISSPTIAEVGQVIVVKAVDENGKPTEWKTEKKIGKNGSGANSETFNNSSNVASGNNSHAEGHNTGAYGICSHAEGSGTMASGNYSHSEGLFTRAMSENQHVQGKYNILDTKSKYAHIVGNGTSSKRSNAHTLDWSGNAWFAGNVYVGGTGQDDETAKKLTTEDDVISLINSALGVIENGTY